MSGLTHFILIIGFIAGGVMATPDNTATVDKYVNFTEIYVAQSPAANEVQRLMVTGVFPNGCYRWKGAEVNHIDDFTHEVRGLAQVSQSMCITMLIPFTREVELGILKRGRHVVRAISADGSVIEKRFEI
jgi:hypothetical protein